jgi:hypothetical protein
LLILFPRFAHHAVVQFLDVFQILVVAFEILFCLGLPTAENALSQRKYGLVLYVFCNVPPVTV